jgi:hypothetical protein
VTARPTVHQRLRAALWNACACAAEACGRGPNPICNICDQPVLPGSPWQRSHCPGRAKAFGGKVVGIAHTACNRKHGAEVVVPSLAKALRQRAFHLGITGPGRGPHPMRAGVMTRETKTMRRGLRWRLSHVQKHAKAMKRRKILYVPAAAPPLQPEA